MQSIASLLLLATVAYSVHVPFYCKIRKTNCQLRPESSCCQYLASSTTTTTTTTISTSSGTIGDRVTTLATVESTDIQIVQENENIQNASFEEIFEAEPSEIDEVFLKVSGENIEANLITTSTGKPEKYAPRFCLKLKFNCKLRSSHACCKFPLPPRDDNQALTTAIPKPVNIQVRPTRIQITPVSDTEGKNNKRKSPFRRPLRKQQTNIEKENEVGTAEKNETNKENVVIENKRKVPLRNSGQRPVFNPARKSSSLAKRRRPEYSSVNKSPVCRIINCKRNKNHKCCHEPTVKTTTQKTITSSTTQSDETTGYMNIEMVKKQENDQMEEELEETAFVSHKQITSSVKPAPIQTTNPIRINNYTDDIMTEYTQVKNIDTIEETNDIADHQDKIITTMTYRDTDIGAQTTQQSISMEYETTTIMEYFPTENILFKEEENDQSIVPLPVFIQNVHHEQKTVEEQIDQVQNNSSTLKNVEKAMYKPHKEPQTLKLKQSEKTSVKEQAKQVEMTTKQFVMTYNMGEKGQPESSEQTQVFQSEQAKEQAKPVEIPTKQFVMTDTMYIPHEKPHTLKQTQREKTEIKEQANPVQIRTNPFVMKYNVGEKEQQESSEQAQVSQTENVEQSQNITPNIVQQEKTLEDISNNDYPTYEIENNDYTYYEDTEQVDNNRELISSPSLHIPIPDNNIDKEALDPNQILPRIAGECFRFDCLSQPHHGCCRPHTANKRQTGTESSPKHGLMKHLLVDHPGRVTATVTRVQKTVRW